MLEESVKPKRTARAVPERANKEYLGVEVFPYLSKCLKKR